MPKRKYNFNYNYSYSSKFSSLSSSLSFLCYTLLLKLAFLFFYSLSSSRSTTVFAFFLSSSKIYPVSQKIPKTVWRGNLFSETRSRLTWSCQKSFIASSLFPLSCCSYLKNNILDTIQAGSASIISGKNKNRFLLSYQGLTAYSPSICKSSPFFIVDWSASSFPSRTLQPLKSQRMFSSTSPNNSNDDNGNTGIPSPLYFGPWNLDRSQVFYHSEHVLGIVNLKPLVPGHVLIIPKRVVNRIADLSPSELQDLFSTVQIVGPTLEKHFGASALNIAIQDGKEAGQSVPHVHCHILPRKSGDYERNDDVYEELEKQELSKEWTKDEDRRPRTMEQMTEEAQLFHSLFTESSLPI